MTIDIQSTTLFGLRYTLRNSTRFFRNSGDFIVETYVVVWSGEKEKQEHDRQMRPAPSVEEQKRNRPVFPAGFGRTQEDQSVIDLRNRWQKEKQRT